MIAFDYIDTNSALDEWVGQLPDEGVIAFDTEFARETTFHPEPALIQMRFGDRTGMIDPQSVNDFSSLVRLLENPQMVKVMHSCEEDLEVFLRLCNALPTPLFDTQVAAAFAGMDYSLSYSRLVEHFAGITIDKSETRSNWLKRPLTDAQLQYAATDVQWLVPIYQQLKAKLEQQQRDHWCDEESAIRLSRANTSTNPSDAYLRIKSAWRLSQDNLVRLQKLCEWREGEAVKLNVPRGRVISDSAILDLLSIRLKNKSQLHKVKGIGSYTVRIYGDKLLELATASIATSEYLPSLPDKRSGQYREHIRAMQSVVRGVASELNLPVELLGRKRDLEDYLSSHEDSLIANSWRSTLLSDRLNTVIAQA